MAIFTSLERPRRLKGNELENPEALRKFAEEAGVEAPKKKSGGILGTLSAAMDILNTGAYAVGGLLSRGSAAKGIEKKITPGEAIWGKPDKDNSFLESVPMGAVRFATDIFFDPVTYLTLGTGGVFKPALKIGIKGAEKILINKTGKELLKDLADDLVSKGISSGIARKKAENQIFSLVGETGAKTIESRGGLELIKKAFEKTGKEFTDENVKAAIKNGMSELIDPGGLKYMGKVLIPGATLKSPFIRTFSAISKTMEKMEGGKELVEGLGKIKNAIGRKWDRDLGLPGKFKYLKQGAIDIFDQNTNRAKDQVATIFSGINLENRKAIFYANDKKDGILNLDPMLRPVAKRIKEIYKAVAREEEKRELLDTALEDYVTHIYKNKEKAASILSEIRKGVPTALLKYNKGRTIHTIEEAKALGLEPIEDMAEVLYIRLIAHEKAKIIQDFFYGAPGKASRLIKEFGLAGEKLTTQKVPYEVFRQEGKLLTALDKAIEGHRANSVLPFVDIYGKIVADFKPGPYGYASLEEAQKSSKELFDLKNIKESLVKGVSPGQRANLMGDILKILGNGTVGEQGALGLAPIFEKGRFADETFNDVKELVDMSESFTLEELRIADARRRIQDQATGEWIGLKSTFPDWITENLRRRDLLDSVIKHFESGTIPKPLKRLPKDMTFTQASDLPDVPDVKKLYDLVKQKIAERANLKNIDELNNVLTTPSLFPDSGGLALRDITVVRQIKERNPELARRVLEMGERWTRLGDIGLGVPASFKNIHIPENIGKDILKFGKKIFDDEDVNFVLRGYDKYMQFWKGTVTVIFPSFHGRNAISNIANNVLDISLEAINPFTHTRAVKILTGADGKIINDLGEEFTFEEIRKLIKKHQIFQSSFARSEVGRLLKQGGWKGAASKFNLAEKGRILGRSIENEARVLNFVKQLKRGFSPEDAAARTKEFLFDYDNLSKFEKEILRRYIPFYTFTRKNIALQLKTFFTRPGITAAQAKAYNAIEDMFARPKTKEEEQFAPEFVREGLNWMIAHKGDDRTFLVGFDLPIESAFKQINNPLASALSMLTPVLKAPIEYGSGVNFFTGRKIADDDSGVFAKDYPVQLKQVLGYSEFIRTGKDGTPYTVRTVDPQKKWIFQAVSTIAGSSRFVSMRNLEQLNSFVTSAQNALTGRTITMEDKVNILGFFTGLRTVTRSLEAEKAKQQKEEARSIQDVLERKGFGASFEKFFMPKEQEFNKGFGNLFSKFKRKKKE